MKKTTLRVSILCPLFASAFLSPCSQIHAQEPVPIGPQFQVNEATSLFQGNPVVAARDDGSFIVVWESDADDAGDLFHRIFDSAGMPLGAETLVNSYTTGEQSHREHAVAALPDRSFVIVWDSQNLMDTNVYGRRFFADGMANGAQFQVNALGTGYQFYPSVAAAADGGFAVVWSSAISTGSDSDGRSIQMRRWDSEGAPIASEFQVNTYTTFGQSYPAIASSGLGDFVVVWVSEGSPGDDTDDTSIQARRFLQDGSPIGDQFQVNSFTPESADTTRIAIGADGAFVVTWRAYESPGDDASESSTQARRFAPDATPIGDQFQVNSFTPGNNDDAAPIFDPAGGFFVVWESEPEQLMGMASPDGSGNSVQGRRFLGDGTPVGQELTINQFTDGNQDDPVLAIVGLERAVVVFESAGSTGGDTSGDSVQARLIDICPGPNDGMDADGDLIADDCDACQGVNSTGDSDNDGVCNDLDLCSGDDATGDGDNDGLCADRDCNDADPLNRCAIFADDFESGGVTNWSSSVG
ncbi:MAG: hypothetical protein MI919_20360 [Holophagales bacterium]|nr:hypothetical protein [Holophagales bacterium]